MRMLELSAPRDEFICAAIAGVSLTFLAWVFGGNAHLIPALFGSTCGNIIWYLIRRWLHLRRLRDGVAQGKREADK